MHNEQQTLHICPNSIDCGRTDVWADIFTGFLGHLLRDDLINPVKMSVRPSVRPYIHNQTQCSHKPNSVIC